MLWLLVYFLTKISSGSYEEGEADTDSEGLSEECDSEDEHDDEFTEESEYEMFSAPSAKTGGNCNCSAPIMSKVSYFGGPDILLFTV